jgi:hypothetical protein
MSNPTMLRKTMNSEPYMIIPSAFSSNFNDIVNNLANSIGNDTLLTDTNNNQVNTHQIVANNNNDNIFNNPLTGWVPDFIPDDIPILGGFL